MPVTTPSAALWVSRTTIAVTTAQSAYWPPIDRSTLPETMSSPEPKAAMPIAVMFSRIVNALETVKKLSYVAPNATTSATHRPISPIRFHGFHGRSALAPIPPSVAVALFTVINGAASYRTGGTPSGARFVADAGRRCRATSR